MDSKTTSSLKPPYLRKKRNAARKRLLRIAEALTGSKLDDNTLIVSTSGRYEFRNKGIDVFIEAINKLRHDEELQRDVVAFIEVPGWIARPRTDLQERLSNKQNIRHKHCSFHLLHMNYTTWTLIVY